MANNCILKAKGNIKEISVDKIQKQIYGFILHIKSNYMKEARNTLDPIEIPLTLSPDGQFATTTLADAEELLDENDRERLEHYLGQTGYEFVMHYRAPAQLHRYESRPDGQFEITDPERETHISVYPLSLVIEGAPDNKSNPTFTIKRNGTEPIPGLPRSPILKKL